MRDEVDGIGFLSVFFQGGLIIDKSDDDISISCDIRLSHEDEISIIDSFLIHRVSLCSEEEVFIELVHDLDRYRNFGFDIFFCEDRHPTGDTSNEWNGANCEAIIL